jgi:hypothetical protein
MGGASRRAHVDTIVVLVNYKGKRREKAEKSEKKSGGEREARDCERSNF